MSFSHINRLGKAIMVNVVGKSPTVRTARAYGEIIVPRTVFNSVIENTVVKGDVISVSRLAGIMGAKKTSDLIPLCHPLNIEGISVDIVPVEPDTFKIYSEVCIYSNTGVEMEALTAVNITGLAFYDMCKAISKDIVINNIRLLDKTGGKSHQI